MIAEAADAVAVFSGLRAELRHRAVIERIGRELNIPDLVKRGRSIPVGALANDKAELTFMRFLGAAEAFNTMMSVKPDRTGVLTVDEATTLIAEGDRARATALETLDQLEARGREFRRELGEQVDEPSPAAQFDPPSQHASF
jgi:hypothetical protein